MSDDEEDQPRRKRRSDDDQRASRKKTPAPPDVAVLERKHGLTFNRDGELVPTADGVRRGLYPEKTLLDYDKKQRTLQIEAARAGDEKAKEKIATSILPAKLKRICATDLKQKEKTEKKDPVSEAAHKVEVHRQKDLIYRLMTDNTPDGLHLLAKYAELAYRKLEEEGLRPREPTRADDAKVWDAAFAHVMKAESALEKRALIWLALYISSAFVDVFCPRTEGEYLTDANLLTFFLRESDSPFHDLFDRMLVPAHSDDDSAYARIFATKFSPSLDLDMFAVSATTEWMRLQPWKDMDKWRATRPSEPSIELKLLLKPAEMTAEERNRASANFLVQGERVAMIDNSAHFDDAE